VIFPPGDVLTSLVWDKEKDTKVEDLLNRLCQLRGLNLADLKPMSDVGEKLELQKTVGELDLVFIELVDRKASKKAKKKEKEEGDGADKPQNKLQKGKPSGITVTPGKYNTYSIADQLFPEELQALKDLKTNYEICQNYSDEFMMSCLFARKLDLVRTHVLLQANWKWRKENNFVNLPTIADINLDIMKSWILAHGTRGKDGTGVLYVEIQDMEIGKEPWTIPSLMKWIAWFYFVGIFAEGMDIFRNGMTMIEDLEGYGWKHFDLEFQKKMSSIWTDTFPLRVKKIVVMNPPGIFEAIIKIAKTFMKAKMLDRMEVLTKKDLPKLVSKDQLVEKFGGNYSCTREQGVALLKEWAAINEPHLIAPGRQTS